MATLITLLTDFGTADSYVGEVKGVLLSQVHGVVLADITHQVAPGDLRAPAAGQLALGASLSHLGQPITDPYRSPLPVPREDGGVVVGEVLYVDRFGTLISNIPGDAVEPGVRIKVAGTEIGTLARTFGDVKRGVLAALVGSGGTVEIAVRDGSAARLLGVGVGAEVRA